jgi:hypothetical protein
MFALAKEAFCHWHDNCNVITNAGEAKRPAGDFIKPKLLSEDLDRGKGE